MLRAGGLKAVACRVSSEAGPRGSECFAGAWVERFSFTWGRKLPSVQT